MTLKRSLSTKSIETNEKNPNTINLIVQNRLEIEEAISLKVVVSKEEKNENVNDDLDQNKPKIISTTSLAQDNVNINKKDKVKQRFPVVDYSEYFPTWNKIFTASYKSKSKEKVRNIVWQVKCF